MATLRLNHVTKQFIIGGKKAVADFCIDVPQKEFIVIVGPSGCGKTTLLRLIAGLETVTEGEIFMDDVNVNKVKPKDRSVTFVFQNYALFPHMTAYQNIAFGLKIAGKKKDEIDAKVIEAAQILGIKDELSRRPRELSGGQRQRVVLGRAMVRSPKFFLLDEPLSNLDPKLRSEMRVQIADLYEKLDATFVYVTHDQVEAMTMATRIVVMNDGAVQQIDTPKRIYERPANKFVAGFIGTPEMNFFDGVLKRESDCVRLTFLNQNFKLPLEMFDGVDNKYLDGKNEISVGIRAEDISIASSEDAHILKATVNSCEVLGREALVYAHVFGVPVVFKAFEPFKRNSKINIVFDTSRLHIFSALTGKNIIVR